uniref:Acyl-CoA-binding protein n=1 Tax=Pfiesteria piscicida TaxID=71001 RepID=A3E3V5_PFIPI|nr:acyl-CoA-binding protein [Pfiesteria piscicida]
MPFQPEGSAEEQYEAALAFLKEFQPSKTVPNDRKLKLYAFFKQLNEGDVTGSRPGMFSWEARAKFDAWTEVKGLDKEACMKGYVEELQKQVEEFA